jgi:NADPH:quinone reductase-like Zn-dependent oxidoreductase
MASKTSRFRPRPESGAPPERGSDPMRAVVHDRYGPPEVLRLEAVARPVPEDDEVLVRIHATTVARMDCSFRCAKPFVFYRFLTGLRRPRRRILGSELAGEVAAVGAGVSGFAVGDRVFGSSGLGFGAHAEFICTREGACWRTRRPA